MQQPAFSELKQKFELLRAGIRDYRGLGKPFNFTANEMDNIDDWIRRLGQPSFQIIFIGTFNAGKSTIINAFFDRLLLPQANMSLTAKATRVHKNNQEKEYFTVIHKDGTTETIYEISLLREYVAVGGALDTIESVDIYIDNWPLCR